MSSVIPSTSVSKLRSRSSCMTCSSNRKLISPSTSSTLPVTVVRSSRRSATWTSNNDTRSSTVAFCSGSRNYETLFKILNPYVQVLFIGMSGIGILYWITCSVFGFGRKIGNFVKPGSLWTDFRPALIKITLLTLSESH